MGTPFTTVYNCFLNKITDDMYMELTPEDTNRDLQNLLINSIPEFEFPRKDLYDYNLNIQQKKENELTDEDFNLGPIWGDNELDNNSSLIVVDNSKFNCDLTLEEINILSILMMNSWLQRQITSIENVRMKYSGSDFKFTSQANHLAKLLKLLEETKRQSTHMQRLYKRRRISKQGNYESNWKVFREINYDN